MNRTFCVTCGLYCALQISISIAAEPPLQEAIASSELQTRVELLSNRIAALEGIISNPALSEESRASFNQALDKLKSDLNSIREQLDYSDPRISEDVLASRNGPGYISPPTQDSSQTKLFSLSNDLSSQSGLEISGFMDAVYETNSVPEHGNSAYLNQVEIDFAKQINDRAAASLGVIYSDGFQVGVAQISYSIKPESEFSDSPLQSWTAFAGQFDAPFGEDVNSYASNSRKSISTPEIVLATHGGWNDVGVASNWTFSKASLDAWAVRGYSLQLNSEIDEPIDVLNVTGGTRLNLHLSDYLRCGGSCAFGWLSNGPPASAMFGAHAVVTQGLWSFIAEGIILQESIAENSLDHRGYYLQGIREIGHFFALARVDHLEMDQVAPHNHLSLGGGVNLGSGLEFRSEFRLDSESNNHQGLAQIVATF